MASLSRLAQIGTSEVKGLGGKRSSALAKAGIDSVADLLHHVPRRYIDRSIKSPIAQIPIGSKVMSNGSLACIAYNSNVFSPPTNSDSDKITEK